MSLVSDNNGTCLVHGNWNYVKSIFSKIQSSRHCYISLFFFPIFCRVYWFYWLHVVHTVLCEANSNHSGPSTDHFWTRAGSRTSQTTRPHFQAQEKSQRTEKLGSVLDAPILAFIFIFICLEQKGCWFIVELRIHPRSIAPGPSGSPVPEPFLYRVMYSLRSWAGEAFF